MFMDVSHVYAGHNVSSAGSSPIPYPFHALLSHYTPLQLSAACKGRAGEQEN